MELSKSGRKEWFQPKIGVDIIQDENTDITDITQNDRKVNPSDMWFQLKFKRSTSQCQV